MQMIACDDKSYTPLYKEVCGQGLELYSLKRPLAEERYPPFYPVDKSKKFPIYVEIDSDNNRRLEELCCGEVIGDSIKGIKIKVKFEGNSVSVLSVGFFEYCKIKKHKIMIKIEPTGRDSYYFFDVCSTAIGAQPHTLPLEYVLSMRDLISEYLK